MFVAIDKNNNRVFASRDTDGEKKYYCPVCRGEVRLRSYKEENLNIPHFAHINSCTDDFTTDMSEWHIAWQELFPKGNREVVITNGEEKHRADVLCYGTVIEFQHSPISKYEFTRRNNFYTSAGYKIVWIFDAIDVIDDGRLEVWDNWEETWGSGAVFRWKRPWRFLRNFIPQSEKNISIFFQIVPFGTKPKDKYDVCYMDNAVWMDLKYKTRWGSFRTSDNAPTNYAELLDWLEERWKTRKQG